MTIYNELMKAREKSEKCDVYMFGESTDVEPEEYDLDKININSLSPSQLLFVANSYCSFRSGYIYKMVQIKTYDWLEKDNLMKCVGRLGKIISADAVFEKRLEIFGEKELYNRNLIGNVDCIDGSNVYEFKCVHELDAEHYIQLAIYYYMHEMKGDHKKKYIDKFVLGERTREKLAMKEDRVIFKGGDGERVSGVVTRVCKNKSVSVKVNGKVVRTQQGKIVENLTIDAAMVDIDKKFTFRYYLYNILNNEMFEIRSTLPRLKQMIEMLVFNKYMVDTRVDDATFLKLMREKLN
ncbi:MAG: putative helicase/exonuclease [Harvfovirus sp.]|uniref:Putative helicase/exonuclease n=1 Tax=Harvfovirus sp. TaxID=2487768 RepID=A0A3G5A284_9VIRU|nr:MAG: putative helicase/exonuclease [Harvfovirus sp.]